MSQRMILLSLMYKDTWSYDVNENYLNNKCWKFHSWELKNRIIRNNEKYLPDEKIFFSSVKLEDDFEKFE